MNEKDHSKEYLKEYIAENDIPEWLIELIQETIKTNGEISETKKSGIYSNLLKENKIEASEGPINDDLDENIKEEKDDSDDLGTDRKLIIDKITHISGVNALAQNSCLHLTSNCTVVFGLNGTGKSGYF